MWHQSHTVTLFSLFSHYRELIPIPRFHIFFTTQAHTRDSDSGSWNHTVTHTSSSSSFLRFLRFLLSSFLIVLLVSNSGSVALFLIQAQQLCFFFFIIVFQVRFFFFFFVYLLKCEIRVWIGEIWDFLMKLGFE